MAAHDMPVKTDDIIIVGSGIGGLACALSMAPRSVTVVTKTEHLEGGSSLWAQGGIAAAVGPDDSAEEHAVDTITAGAGLTNPRRARDLTGEGAAALDWLIQEGVPFDRNAHGELALAKEGAHRFARIVHAGGDTTGYVMMRSLIERVVATPSINVLDDTFAWDLVIEHGRVAGLVTFDTQDGWVFRKAPVVVLATGGVGMAWMQTTNPVEATGDGLAMAARAGADLADLEFVQFHPTALKAKGNDGGASLPLLTEALRGAGALLLDESGERFMLSEHPDAELAPRDVVARAIYRRMHAGEDVFLDLRPVLNGAQADHFPTAVEYAREAGFDPYKEALPVTPAAHYHMGGVQVDESGRSSIAGLWACGEVTATGVHGANRLASNSLLEAVVYARRAADSIRGYVAPEADAVRAPAKPATGSAESVAGIVASARQAMSRGVGIERTGRGLQAAHGELASLQRRLTGLVDETPLADAKSENVRTWGEARNVLLIARMITLSALRRTESRGAHYRRDFPETRPEWRRQQSIEARSTTAFPETQSDGALS